nr:PREDICTED: rho GTPase-activating protein 20-like [Bos indicus]
MIFNQESKRVPLRECTLCLLGSHSLLYPEAPEGQQSHQCGILAHGHEHPYGIKMSCIPATGLLQQQLEGSTSASALQEAFLEGPQELQDQFILKPRHSARNQARKQQGKGVLMALLTFDFLRNIQGSIFSASLYDKWLDVIDQGEEEDKISATQRLLDQLPRANVVFLRYLFAVLRNIEQHSSSNQMTAYNLSVCITPSMLCLSNSGSSENFTKQISFIQFLIENCLKIFGEDITCLFGETSVSSDNSDITDITDNSEKVAASAMNMLLNVSGGNQAK